MKFLLTFNRKFLHYCSAIVLCSAVILLCGCDNKIKTAAINIQSAASIQSTMQTSRATMDGRTIRLGEDKPDAFGPSFEFDKLR